MFELLTKGRRKLAGKRAIVTGASAGIGRVLAIELAKRGVKLVLVARSRDALLETVAACAAAGSETAIVVDDITLPSTRQAAIDAALHQFGGLDILINNAGVSALGHFADADEERNRRIMEVNYFAPAELIRAALPHLANGVDPLVVNIGSVLGHRGVPHMSEYCASKFALRGLTEGLRGELRIKGIDLLLVSPGTVDTGFFEHLLEIRSKPPWFGRQGVSAERVAWRTCMAMQNRRREIIVGVAARWMWRMNRLFPRIVDRIVSRMG